MSKSVLSRTVQPYLDHPLIKNKDASDFERLDDNHLNEIIRSVDLILRGLRENYYTGQKTPRRLHAGHFSSTILISRGWSFLDTAHATNYVDSIIESVYKDTKTTNRQNVVNNIRTSIIPKLEGDGLLELDSSQKTVTTVMPYPVSSKLFVQKRLIDNPYLYRQQINHFGILGKVQYFPELTSTLKEASENPDYFDRDFEALSEIDVIRNRNIKGREFTLAKAYLLDKETSYDIWKTVLETGDQVRLGLKELMEYLGKLGGFASQSELSIMTTWNMRTVNRLIRRVDNMGLAQRSHTLNLEDALSRPIETKVSLNYHQLKSAEMMLTLCRSVPESSEILARLRTKKRLDEDELINEFDPGSVGKIRNALSHIGVITEQSLDEGIWEITPNKESEDFLLEIETIMAQSRRVLGENFEIRRTLEEFFKGVDDEKLEKTAKEVEKDFLDELGNGKM